MYPKLLCRDDILKMLDDLTIVRTKMLDLCEKLPPERLVDPVYSGTWSVLKNLAHLAFAELFMLAYIQARPQAPAKELLPKEPAHDLASIRIALDEAHAQTIAFLKANPESVLSENCVFGRNLSEQTVGGIYYHIIEHEIGHRTFTLHKLAKLAGN